MKEGNKRDILLDVLKGMGIILVVFAHTCKTEISSAIYLFHMPLFFVLSGCALSYSSRKDIIGFRGYFKSLIVPYFVFSLVSFSYWGTIEWRLRPSKIPALFEGVFGTFDIRAQEFLNIFTAYSVKRAFEYNVVMWFLPCLFCCLVLYKWLKAKAGRLLPFIVCFVAAGYFMLAGLIPVLPWCFEIAMVALPFVWIGDAYYVNARAYNDLGGGFLAVLIIVVIMMTAHPHVNMLEHSFAKWWQFYPLALSCIFLCLRLCNLLIHCEHGILQWLGRNSLIIMCVHEPVKRIVLKLASVLSGIDTSVLRHSVVASMLITALILGVIYPLVCMINRHAPMLIGKRQR